MRSNFEAKHRWAGILVILVLTAMLATAGGVAGAFPTPNDDGGHAHTAGVVTDTETCGAYVRGAEDSGQNIDPASYTYSMPSPLGIAGAAGAIDFHWVHDTDGDFIVWDMGKPVSVVDLFPSIDHSPVPQEAIESTVWGSNDLTLPEALWVVGDIATIFDSGWNSAWIADDWVTRWVLPVPSRYIGVHWGGPKAMIGDGDGEIDALCAPAGPDLTVTKEPKPGQPRPVPGGTFSYIIRVKNIGNAPTPPPPVDVMLRDELPAGASFVFWTANSGRCSSSPPFVDCVRGRMAPGEEWWVEIRVRIPNRACVDLVNKATVDRLNRIKELNEPNNLATLTTPVGNDRCIDTDGTTTGGDGFANPVTAGSVQAFFGAPLRSWPTGSGSVVEGLDMFDNDGNAAWTLGINGDDLHVEGPAYPGAIRDGNHDHPEDPHVLDYDGSLNVSGQAVNCDFEFGAFCPSGLPGNVRFYDSNNDGDWDDGEDIVLDVNNNGIFD